MNALEWVDGQPWLITPSGLDKVRALAGRDGDALAAIVAREGGADLVAAKAGKKAEGSKTMTVRDGVATIPVHGVISRYSTMLQDFCGGTSTEAVARDLGAAMSDPAVKAVLLDVDTPGGAASGVLELAGMIRSAAERKPCAAVSSGQCCSAGYWIASAAGEVAVSPAAVVGSIGAVCQVDTKEKKDVETYRSKQSPMKHVSATSDEFRESTQSLLDGLAGEFISAVAEYRGTTPAKVQANYGKGGTMLGRDAVKAGMADRIGSYETTHARLAAGKVKVRPKPLPAKPSPAAKTKGNTNMGLRSFLASLQANSPEAVEAALAEAGDTGEFATLKVARPAAPAFDAAAERAKIKAEVEKELLASTRASLAEVFTGNALAFVASVADRTTPAESEALAALYVDAAMSDHAAPIKAGDAAFSRVKFFTGAVESRPKHKRGDESVPSNDSVAAAKLAGLSVLPSAVADDAAKAKANSDRLIVEMCKATPEGRAYLLTADGLALAASADTAKAS